MQDTCIWKVLWNEHKYAIANVLVNLQSRLCMVHNYHCKNGRVALTWMGLLQIHYKQCEYGQIDYVAGPL